MTDKTPIDLKAVKVVRDEEASIEKSTTETVPQNVPQRYANQAAHAPYAVHARRFLLSGFVSVENKECLIYFPKLKVAGSIPVARSKFPQ